METNYQKFLSGEYCNRLDKEVFDMIVRNKRLLAEFNSTDISDSKARTALQHELFGCVGKHSESRYKLPLRMRQTSSLSGIK